jgi:hypothetical protein
MDDSIGVVRVFSFFFGNEFPGERGRRGRGGDPFKAVELSVARASDMVVLIRHVS